MIDAIMNNVPMVDRALGGDLPAEVWDAWMLYLLICFARFEVFQVDTAGQIRGLGRVFA